MLYHSGRSDDSGISHPSSTDSTYMDMSANPISPPALYDRTQSMKSKFSDKSIWYPITNLFSCTPDKDI